MLAVIWSNIIGALSVLGYAMNTIFWVIPIVILSFLKLVPIKPWQTTLSYLLDGCATCWISINNTNQKLTSNTKWDVEGVEGLTPNDWYLVISNHQSWVDIVALQRIFNRKIPFLKFFLKKELIWVPFLGVAWWALDFPFMRRYSKSFLAKNPHLKGKDLETTRIACQKFQHKPVSIMNFVEGTRLTPHKHIRQGAKYRHLLIPKAGGVAFVLNAMGSQLHKLVDVTIHYPDGIPTFWDFACGRVKKISIRVKVLSFDDILDGELLNLDYFQNKEERIEFQRWVNSVWQQKDSTLEQLSAG